MEHLGDISKINGADIEPVDLITFGSPCQDLSVAGKRAGLKHEANGDNETTRSGLFMEAVRIIKEMREATNGKYPRFALWENVPGAFSSNKGEDFRIVLEEIAKITEKDAIMPEVPKGGWAYADCFSGDGWSMAYRVFDAQHWGVPQRRRRIHLVADFAGERAEEILFEREGLRGYFAPGQQARQGAAANAESSIGAEDSQGKCYGIASELETEDYKGPSPDIRARLVETAAPALTAKYVKQGSDGTVVCMATQQGGAEIREDDKAPTLTAAAGMSGNNQPVIAMGIDTYNGSETGDVAATLGVNCGISTGRNGVMQPIAFAQNQRDEVRDLGNVAGALQAEPGMKQQTFIIDSIGGQAETAKETDIAPTLKATHYKFPPVFAGGFCTEHSAKARSVGYQEETSPTLRAGTVPATVYDARGNGSGMIAATITGAHEANISDYTNVVCLEDENFKALTYQRVTGPLMANSHPGSYTGQDAFSDMLIAGVDCRNMNEFPELYPTLQAKPNGGQSLNFSGAVRQNYIVRRLTPTECARLQGFADDWGHIDEKESFTEEEYRFWLEVRNTHAAINGKQVKDYTEKQMLSWYNKLHTDSAEYKMWGNGIALPPALYVMQGIAAAIEETTKKTA